MIGMDMARAVAALVNEGDFDPYEFTAQAALFAPRKRADQLHGLEVSVTFASPEKEMTSRATREVRYPIAVIVRKKTDAAELESLCELIDAIDAHLAATQITVDGIAMPWMDSEINSFDEGTWQSTRVFLGIVTAEYRYVEKVPRA